jgi:hypothetical protein
MSVPYRYRSSMQPVDKLHRVRFARSLSLPRDFHVRAGGFRRRQSSKSGYF